MLSQDSIDTFSARGLACARGGRNVFADLDFHLTSGGALLLLGPNGSGKSSLLRLMAGIAKPTAGMMHWNGIPIGENREAHTERLHYIGHQDAIKTALTVRENLRFWTALHKAGRKNNSLEGKALEFFGLDSLADLPARYLSAGQKRRLTLARLVAAPAPLWLLDEPTAALDSGAVTALMELITDHRHQGGMLALSIHGHLKLEDADILRLDHFTAPDIPFEEQWR